MKNKILIILFTVLLPSTLFASGFVTICGMVGDDNIKDVMLYQVDNADITKISKTKVADNGSFGFCFQPQNEGFYLLGVNDLYLQRIYVKPGEKIDVTLFRNSIEVSDNCSEENRILAQWEKSLQRLKNTVYYSVVGFNQNTDQQIIGSVKQIQHDAKQFSDNIKSANTAFKTLMQQCSKIDMCYYASFYLVQKQPTNPELVKALREVINPEVFHKLGVAGHQSGSDALNLYWQVRKMYDGVDADMSLYVNEIKDPYVCGKLFVKELEKVNSYDEFVSRTVKYGKLLTDVTLRKEADSIGAKLFTPAVGALAPEFSYPDVNGKMVSLSDFRGKIVVLGTWASWCSPCIKHLPDFCKLSKMYDASDVVFLGVSFNSLKQRGQWMNCIDRFGLAGSTVQLLADGFSTLAEYYRMTSVGRYIVIDRQGKIVNLDAPTDFTPLKTVVDNCLKR